MFVEHPIINKYINTVRLNHFYNDVITDLQRKRFLIFSKKCESMIGSNLDEFETQVVYMLMLKHYFMTCV